jgi:hypothetical protein
MMTQAKAHVRGLFDYSEQVFSPTKAFLDQLLADTSVSLSSPVWVMPKLDRLTFFIVLFMLLLRPPDAKSAEDFR